MKDLSGEDILGSLDQLSATGSLFFSMNPALKDIYRNATSECAFHVAGGIESTKDVAVWSEFTVDIVRGDVPAEVAHKIVKECGHQAEFTRQNGSAAPGPCAGAVSQPALHAAMPFVGVPASAIGKRGTDGSVWTWGAVLRSSMGRQAPARPPAATSPPFRTGSGPRSGASTATFPRQGTSRRTGYAKCV